VNTLIDPYLEDSAEFAPRGRVALEAGHVWEFFWQLSAARGSNGFGLNPFSYSEIDAFGRLNRIAFEPWEVAALKQMDAAYLRAV
jgi:hypothetical protein